MYLSLILIGLSLACAEAEDETQNVYFSLIVSGGENGYRSSGAIPAIHIALEQIERHQLLPGYNLTYVKAQNSKVLMLHAYRSIARCYSFNTAPSYCSSFCSVHVPTHWTCSSRTFRTLMSLRLSWLAVAVLLLLNQ